MAKLSIITINLNNMLGLQKTVQSLLTQTCRDFEYIIIDGGSIDGSLDIIKQHQDRIDHYLSEKDNSIYNAMNKGLKKATGEYCMFLNSGDYLMHPGTIEEVLPLLTGEKIIYGNLQIEETKKKWIKQYPDELMFSYFVEDTLPHSAGIFILREAFTGELEMYDECLKVVADWKWFIIALFKYGYSYKHIHKTIGVFDYNGLSGDPGMHRFIINEKKMVLENYFPVLYKDIAELLTYKQKYKYLMMSRFFKTCLKIRNILKPEKKQHAH